MHTCTNILLAQMQVCPAFLKADDTTPAAAWSMSASSNTMKGALPPSSRETCGCAIAVCQVNCGRSQRPTACLGWHQHAIPMLHSTKGRIMLELV